MKFSANDCPWGFRNALATSGMPYCCRLVRTSHGKPKQQSLVAQRSPNWWHSGSGSLLRYCFTFFCAPPLVARLKKGGTLTHCQVEWIAVAARWCCLCVLHLQHLPARHRHQLYLPSLQVIYCTGLTRRVSTPLAIKHPHPFTWRRTHQGMYAGKRMGVVGQMKAPWLDDQFPCAPRCFRETDMHSFMSHVDK